MILFKTYRLLDTLTEYSKLPDGTWVAELRAPQLRVTGPSPNDCRHRLLDRLDELFAEWLVRKTQPEPFSPSTSGDLSGIDSGG